MTNPKGNVANRQQQRRDTRPPAVSAEVKLDARTPIPFENGNYSFSNVSGEKYIPFFPPKDNFLDTILEARTLSPTQDACVNTKTNYTVGEGIYIKSLKDGAVEPQDWKDWAKRCNNRRQSLNKVIRAVVDSYYGVGNVPVEIVRGTAGTKKFVYVYRRNVLDCRFAWPDDNYASEPTHVLVSRQFRRKNFIPNAKNHKKIPLYQSGKKESWLKDGGVERTMLWIKHEKTGFDFYGLPSWISSLIFAVLEYEGGGRFNLDNIENNMIVDAILTLSGNLNDKEAQRIGRQIVQQHTGKGKRGRVAVIASEQGINGSTLQNLTTHKEGSYVETDKMCETKILLANEWNAELAGLQKSGALGKGAGYLQELYDQAYKNVIRPVVNTMIEELFNPLVEILGEWMSPAWKTFELDIRPTKISQSTSEAATTVVGLTAFLEIIKLVASGAYQLEAAIKLVQARFGLTEQEAKDQLGIITKVDPSVLPKSTLPAGTDNSGRGN